MDECRELIESVAVEPHVTLVFCDVLTMYRHLVSLMSALAVTDVECQRLLYDSHTTIACIVSLLSVASQGLPLLLSNILPWSWWWRSFHVLACHFNVVFLTVRNDVLILMMHDAGASDIISIAAETRTLLVSRMRTNFWDRAFSASKPQVWQTADSQTCHTAVSDSCWRHVFLVSGTDTKCEYRLNCALEILLLTYFVFTELCSFGLWIRDFIECAAICHRFDGFSELVHKFESFFMNSLSLRFVMMSVEEFLRDIVRQCFCVFDLLVLVFMCCWLDVVLWTFIFMHYCVHVCFLPASFAVDPNVWNTLHSFVINYIIILSKLLLLNLHLMHVCCIDKSDTEWCCRLLWKAVFDALSMLLQSAGHGAYVAIVSAVVKQWTVVSGMIHSSAQFHDDTALLQWLDNKIFCHLSCSILVLFPTLQCLLMSNVNFTEILQLIQ